MQPQRILILGVTASGKGTLAFDLARELGAEILSVDSMKVYRRMNVGTAKPTPEMQSRIRYHLIDVVEPSESFSVGRYLELANAAIDDIESRGIPVIAVGGTAMYIKALLYGLFEGPGNDPHLRTDLKKRISTEGTAALHAQLSRIDPEAAQRIDTNDAKRIIRALEVYHLTGKPISHFQQHNWTAPYQGPWKLIAIRRQKSDANHRINTRVKKMMQQGLLQEVKSLLAEQKPLSNQAAEAIGYAEIIRHLRGEMSLEEAVEKIKINTRRFAKSQRTWFKAFRGVTWLDVAPDEPPEQICRRALNLLQELESHNPTQP